MLQPIPLLDKDLDLYRVAAGDAAVERILALAEPLRGARVLHINSTGQGGGVAEDLATHVPLLRSAGLDAHWQVIRGSPEFFVVTKTIHKGLQGMEVSWSQQMGNLFLEQIRANVPDLDGEFHCGP